MYRPDITDREVLNECFETIGAVIRSCDGLRYIAARFRAVVMRATPDNELDGGHEVQGLQNHELVQSRLVDIYHLRCVVEPVQLSGDKTEQASGVRTVTSLDLSQRHSWC